MSQKSECPSCGASGLLDDKHQQYVCEGCGLNFVANPGPMPRRVFISYGHDEHAVLAVKIKHDLQAKGYEVWFDLEKVKPGTDWEAYIEEGLEWVSDNIENGRVILLMSPHSVRRPHGFCLNEIARALQRGLRIIPVVVEKCEPPLSLCRFQWLDMCDCVHG